MWGGRRRRGAASGPAEAASAGPGAAPAAAPVGAPPGSKNPSSSKARGRCLGSVGRSGAKPLPKRRGIPSRLTEPRISRDSGECCSAAACSSSNAWRFAAAGTESSSKHGRHREPRGFRDKKQLHMQARNDAARRAPSCFGGTAGAAQPRPEKLHFASRGVARGQASRRGAAARRARFHSPGVLSTRVCCAPTPIPMPPRARVNKARSIRSWAASSCSPSSAMVGCGGSVRPREPRSLQSMTYPSWHALVGELRAKEAGLAR